MKVRYLRTWSTKPHLVWRGFSSQAYFSLCDKGSNRRNRGHIEAGEGCDRGNLKGLWFGWASRVFWRGAAEWQLHSAHNSSDVLQEAGANLSLLLFWTPSTIDPWREHVFWCLLIPWCFINSPRGNTPGPERCASGNSTSVQPARGLEMLLFMCVLFF